MMRMTNERFEILRGGSAPLSLLKRQANIQASKGAD